MLCAVSTPADDTLKLLLLVAIGAALVALGRWSSGLGWNREASSKAAGGDAREVRTDRKAVPRVWPPSPEQIAASFPFDPSLGKIQVQKFFFKKVDPIPGPSDPDVFADELYVQLFDPDTGHTWWQSYFVATPKGLAKILRDKSWRYLHAPQILVLPRYDLEEIRRAVVSRIMADHEYFKDKEQPEEESL